MLRSSNDITPEILQQIREVAACFFTPKEIAVMLDIDMTFFLEEMENENSGIATAFKQGWLQAEFDLRTCIMQLAKSGSSPAQTMAMDLLKQSKTKMLDR